MSYTLKGTYKLGNTLTGWGGIYLNADVTFKSGDGVVYNSIRVDDGPGNMYYDSTVVVDLDDSTWYDEKLKTIIFETATPVTRRGLTLLSQLCRDPAVGVRNAEEA